MLAALKVPEPAAAARRARLHRRVFVAMVCLAVASVLAAVGMWAKGPQAVSERVDVNFVTEPYEATIYLDDTLLADQQGVPYRTPCTVPDVPARSCRVVFKHDRLPDLETRIDFAEIREVTAQWPSQP